MFNPYRAKVVPGYTKLGNQGTPIVASNGTINASDKRDLLKQIELLMNAHAAPTPDMVVNAKEEAAANRAALVKAFNGSDQEMRILGAAVASYIKETSEREGYARRVLQFRDLEAGKDPLVTVKMKNVMGVIATSPTEVVATEIRDKNIRPALIELSASILVSNKELAQSTYDVLEEKYEEGLEALMVGEDRLWKRMADSAAVARNTQQNFATLTPTVFHRLVEQVNRWGIPTTTCIISSSLWTDIVGGDFAEVIDPVSQYEILTTGKLGTIYGVSMLTDNFRQPNLKFLDSGDIYIVGDPAYHGVFTMHGEMTTDTVNRSVNSEAKKGWFFNQICSMVLGNSASVAKGKKLA